MQLLADTLGGVVVTDILKEHQNLTTFEALASRL